jgi:hypothetical protein
MMMLRIKVYQFFVIIVNKLFAGWISFMRATVAVGSIVLLIDVLIRLNLRV